MQRARIPNSLLLVVPLADETGHAAVPLMTGVGPIATILMHDQDFLDVTADVRPVLRDRVRDDDRHEVRYRARRIRAITRPAGPRPAAEIIGLVYESLEAGHTVADEATHLVFLPPLRAPEVHDIADGVRLAVSDDE